MNTPTPIGASTRLTSQPDKGGRRPAIPAETWPVVFQLRESGLSYARIARELDHMGLCWTTRGSVERLIKGWGTYCTVGRRSRISPQK